jgi:hypothetical protein
MATYNMWTNPKNSVKSDMKKDRPTQGHSNPSAQQYQVDHEEQASAWRERAAKGNVGRGPTTGNAEAGPKRRDFLANKAEKEASARMITDRIGERDNGPRVPKTNHQIRQGQVSPDTNVGRGPTRGNR